jgi:hypothetical protein
MRGVLDAARTPLEQASVELAMANWLLAVPTASPATRWLLGLPEGDDLERIHESARDAQVHLARARKLLGPEEPEAKERWRELRSAASLLDAFATLMFACADKPSSDTYRDACESAASGLGTARESERQIVAASAMMWQAHAFSLADRTERALSTLPDALAKPELLPYDFMARLLRCRILAESGESPAAIALTMRIREVSEDWFPQQDNQAIQARVRLVGVLQARLTREWMSTLHTSPEAVTSLTGTLDSLQEMLFPSGRRNPIYHLETAVPILIEAPPLPAAEPSAPDNATHPQEDEENASSNPSTASGEDETESR